MNKIAVTGIAFFAAAVIAGCSFDGATNDEQDVAIDDAALASAAVKSLVGSYTNTAGDLFAADSLYKLALKVEGGANTFTAERQSTTKLCLRAPCTDTISGVWSAKTRASRLTLTLSTASPRATPAVSYEIVRAEDGGPVSFKQVGSNVRFSMRSDAAPGPSATLTLGDFKLFPREALPAPGSGVTGGCVVYTQMTISRGFTGFQAHLENRVGAFGTNLACRLAVAPLPRDYSLGFEGLSCGSSTWKGSKGADSIAVTDNATRTCKDLPLSKLIVTEKNNGVESTLYAADPAERVIGTLKRSVGIGGENSGTSIATDTGLLELQLPDQTPFVEGSLARATGVRVNVTGIETGNRSVLRVSDLLVCPAKGSTVNCQPGPNVRLGNLCAPENQAFLQSTCGVLVLQ